MCVCVIKITARDSRTTSLGAASPCLSPAAPAAPAARTRAAAKVTRPKPCQRRGAETMRLESGAKVNGQRLVQGKPSLINVWHF